MKVKILEALKKVSIGQYRTPMFYKGSDSFSSVCDGVLSLLVLAIVLSYAFVILDQIA